MPYALGVGRFRPLAVSQNGRHVGVLVTAWLGHTMHTMLAAGLLSAESASLPRPRGTMECEMFDVDKRTQSDATKFCADKEKFLPDIRSITVNE